LYVGDDAESWAAARAHLSIIKGWTAAQWLAAENGDDDMANLDLTDKPIISSAVFGTLMGEQGSQGTFHNWLMAWRAEDKLRDEAMASIINAMAQAINQGGGSVDTAAIMAQVNQSIEAATDRIVAESRDAVADLGEGGASQVRGPQG
jgi:hypothetical protein